MNIQMELRKCCNHPYLIAGVMEKEMDIIDDTMLKEVGYREDKVNWDSFETRRVVDSMIPTSGKMVLLDKLLPKLKSEGHKVLIFSQMVTMLDLLEEFCECRKYNVERLDGRISGNDRQKGIDRFNNNDDAFIFLLSTRAGGVGINLTAADTCIIFDSDWNPQNDIQAMARCHRIGQTKAVTIYRLITRKSFEAEMFDRASRKLGLEQALLGSRQFEGGEDDEDGEADGEKMGAKEMEILLRQGAYAVLLDEDADDVKEFYEQDIDSILDQRSHVRVVEGQKTESWLNKKKNSRASKSMFTGSTAMEHAEIDVNDPDFWSKVLPDLVTPEIMLSTLDDLSKKGKELERDDDDDDEDFDDEQLSSELAVKCKKFFSDIAQMMEGILDLQRRNSLPDRERTLCMKLLLRITLKTDLFDEDFLDQAQQWLTVLEGTRRRGNRQDLYKEAQKDNLLASPESAMKNGLKGRRNSSGSKMQNGKLSRSGRPTSRQRKKTQRGNSGDEVDSFVQPPRKRRTSKAINEKTIPDEDDIFFNEDDDIRIVFGGSVTTAPTSSKKSSRRKSTGSEDSKLAGTRVKKVAAKTSTVPTINAKRGRHVTTEVGNSSSSPKTLFQQRRRSHLAEQNGSNEVEGNRVKGKTTRAKKHAEYSSVGSDGDADMESDSVPRPTKRRRQSQKLVGDEGSQRESRKSSRNGTTREDKTWEEPIDDIESDDDHDGHDPYSETTVM